MAHHIGVTSEPNIKIHKIDPQFDRFFAICTDGIWNNLGHDDVVEIINEYGLREPGTSSDFICSKVKDICHSENSQLDDMTVLVSILNTSPH